MAFIVTSDSTDLIAAATGMYVAFYSQILYLKFFEDLSNAQIAVILRKNKRQVENLLYQAKQSLKSQLHKEGFCYEGL